MQTTDWFNKCDKQKISEINYSLSGEKQLINFEGF